MSQENDDYFSRTSLPGNRKDSELFSELDMAFGRFVRKLAGRDEDSVLFLSAALVSSNRRKGDVCLDLGRLAESRIETGPHGGKPFTCPPLKEWRDTLMASRVVGAPGETVPMILDPQNRLYLYRYWAYEKKLTEWIQARTKADVEEEADAVSAATALQKIFPAGRDHGADWQKVAAVVASLKRFCVISGGPGTGKTYAAARVLALLLSLDSTRARRIFLCAPTGKAAARLAESMRTAKKELGLEASITDIMPEEGMTIHRLLRPVKGTPYFHYHSDNRLPADIVVVDEASMVDLPLMSKLVQAMPDSARLLLMGDRDQLASVEAGSVLGDICGQKERNGFSATFAERIRGLTRQDAVPVFTRSSPAGIEDSIVLFTRRYRFETGGGIHALSQAVNAGDPRETMALLKEGRYPEIDWIVPSSGHVYRRLFEQRIVSFYAGLFQKSQPEEKLECMDRFRILCAVNHGPFGVHAVNHLTELSLRTAGFIPGSAKPQATWYGGKPIIISENDYELGLFNGDVGVTIGAGNRYDAYFRGGGDEVRRYGTHRMPAHHTVYAMSVHRSQGSEFDEVLLVLPDRDNPILTRELLYTGITRARQKLSILAFESVIEKAVTRRIKRTSGLRDALWG